MVKLADSSLANTADYIASLQLPSGAIPWFRGGIIDPWDHVEAIMGLCIGGYPEHARHGFDWLQHNQREDGAWYAAYTEAAVVDASRAETNFVAYPATGLWHYYLCTGDTDAVRNYWPMIRKALQWVLALQTEEGEIYWAVDSVKGISRDALLTGCSSIYKSLECAAQLAAVLREDTGVWLRARTRLGHAIRNKPHLFDRTWESKARYSMDWFYPVLTGVIEGQAAHQRLHDRWHEFVEPGLGCRCVVEEPWVTVAESCELTMACLSAGERERAEEIYSSLQRFQVEDGSWWTGYVFPDDLHWPDERPAWTAAAVLMAADALFRLTPAATLFNQHMPGDQLCL
ncbi:MAG: prenyltransferase [Pseudomonadota bacterium]